MKSCYILNLEGNKASEITKKSYDQLFDIMEEDYGLQEIIHIVKGADTLKELFPDAKIIKIK